MSTTQDEFRRAMGCFATGVTVNRGDIIRISTGNGAGYGDPRERDPAAIASDLKNGYLTPGRAHEIYGTTGNA